jgi:hypothetical protein
MSRYSSNSARSVFVGNIPYNATEEELEEVFRTVGTVVSLRLVKNNDGQPKGFGFCEFKDEQTAQSAIRNLNNHDLNGRPLRVDHASNFGNAAAGGAGDAMGGGPGPSRSGGMGGGGSGPPMASLAQQRALSIVQVHEQIIGVCVPALAPRACCASSKIPRRPHLPAAL